MKYISILTLLALVFLSCKKDKIEEDENIPESLSNGILVLNEGLFQQNNSSLSWVNLGNDNVSTDFFLQKNDRNLGDTGNDMEIYGGKIYIIVNGSHTLEVLDKNSGKSIKQLSMMNGLNGKSPRSIAFYGSKAFITCYDGFVDVLDTASLSIQQRIQVGSNPEDLAVSNGKLYVSNSGGLNYPNVDSTVSVIKLSDYSDLGKITVGKNPGKVISDAQGDIYVISRGDYGSIPARMVRIDSQTDQLEEVFNFDALGIEKLNDNFLITFYNFTTEQSTVGLFNPASETLLNGNYISMSEINTLYGIKYDTYRNKIYCFDAMGFTNSGYLRRYSASGVYEKSYHVGLNPNNVIFYE